MKFEHHLAFATALLACGCGGAELEGKEDLGTADLALQGGSSGKDLFTKATFGGNARTCSTCHGNAGGTFSPADAAARYTANPADPLFRPLDSDDGTTGASYARILNHATILVSIRLPGNVTLADHPTQKRITLERTVPSTLDTPALDPVLMWDGRATSLQDQAIGAILSHAEAPQPPDVDDIEEIVEFERDKLFSSNELKEYAKLGSPAPGLPQGKTASEVRGRAFFDPTTPAGLCAHCHAGPLLNETNAFAPGLPPGSRFANAGVSTFNARKLPVRTFLFAGPIETVTVQSPDPGRALITGDPKEADRFKIMSLRNIKNTAPYFHDGSALTLEAVAAHYAQFFAVVPQVAITLSAQDQADIVAYMKLL